MMKKLLLSLLFSVLFKAAFTQVDSVLQRFKYRINHFRAYSIGISQSGLYNRQEYVPYLVTKYQTVSGNLGAGVSTIHSTDKLLLITNAFINSTYGLNKAYNPQAENKYRTVAVAGQYSLSSRWFAKEKFAELGTDIALQTGADRNETKNPVVIAKNSHQLYRVRFVLGIGKGRLENITDMQNAIWLTKALQEEGRLSKILTAEELNGLGRAVTLANNTRILDARKRTQYVLHTVDNYLQTNHLISQTDINYFSNLNDILFYAFNNIRFSGTEKFIRLTPGIETTLLDNSNSSNEYKNEKRPVYKSVFLTVGINRYKPVTLKHQVNYAVALKAGILDFIVKENEYLAGLPISAFEYNKEVRQLAASLFYEHAFYPNTRTVISLGLSGDIGFQHEKDDSQFFTNSGLQASASYFISYRTRLFVNTALKYYKNVWDFSQSYYLLPDNFMLSAGAGINISF
jgi:hypothetical protein